MQLPFEHTSPASQSEFVLQELLQDAGGVGEADGEGDTEGDVDGEELGEADGDPKAIVNVKDVQEPGVGVGNSCGGTDGPNASGSLVGAFGATDSCLN